MSKVVNIQRADGRLIAVFHGCCGPIDLYVYTHYRRVYTHFCWPSGSNDIVPFTQPSIHQNTQTGTLLLSRMLAKELIACPDKQHQGALQGVLPRCNAWMQSLLQAAHMLKDAG